MALIPCLSTVLTNCRNAQIIAAGGYTEAKEFYDYLLNRINVEFVPKLDSNLPTFSLSLSKKMTYDQFAAKVGEQLQADATHIRFTTVNQAGKPKAPVKYSQQTLNSILFPGSYNYSATSTQKSDALFYEVLDMSLKEMETRKNFKVIWLPEGITKEVRVPVSAILMGER